MVSVRVWISTKFSSNLEYLHLNWNADYLKLKVAGSLGND